MRRKILVALLFLGLACSGMYWAYVQNRPTEVAPRLHPEDAELELSARMPVANNRAPEVSDGFRGDVHPLLHGHAQTEVRAYWEPANVDYMDSRAPFKLRRLYMDVSEAVPSKSYSERDFSGFLPPENVNAAGQFWVIDPEKAAVFLKQFHPAVSTHSASVGRRPGPDGAFAVLRGVSSSHLDIVFRIHAEFDLLPEGSTIPVLKAWYSPACFLGRLLVNRKAGAVEYFRIAVPTDKTTNVHATVWVGNGAHAHNISRVERMELIGGSPQGLEGIQFTDQIELASAHEKLAKLFYKFKDINFLPFDRTLASARAQKKPILAVLIFGPLEDQSC